MDIDPRDRASAPYGRQLSARRTSNSYFTATDDEDRTNSRKYLLQSPDDSKGRKRKRHSTDELMSTSPRNRPRRRRSFSGGAARARQMKEISPSHADSSPHPINNSNHKPTTTINNAARPINEIQAIVATTQQPPFNHHDHLPPHFQQQQNITSDTDYHSNDENLADFIDINSQIDAISDNTSHAGSRNNSNHSGGGNVASFAGRLAWNCKRGDYKPMLASGPRCIDKAVEIIIRASDFLLQDIGCTQLLTQTAFRDRSLGDHIALYFSTREHQLVATYLQGVTPTMVDLAVVSSSDPIKVAGALVASVREGRSARMMAVGREGLCRAVVACAYARLGLSDDRIDFRLMFSKLGGGEKGRRGGGGGGEGDTIVLTLLMEHV